MSERTFLSLFGSLFPRALDTGQWFSPSVCTSSFFMNAPRGLTWRRTIGSVWGAEANLRELKSVKERKRTRTNHHCLVYPALKQNSPELVAEFHQPIILWSLTLKKKAKKDRKYESKNVLESISLVCLPIWLFIPSEQPFQSLTLCGEWVWGMWRLSSRFRQWRVCSQLLAIQSLFFHW